VPEVVSENLMGQLMRLVGWYCDCELLLHCPELHVPQFLHVNILQIWNSLFVCLSRELPSRNFVQNIIDDEIALIRKVWDNSSPKLIKLFKLTRSFPSTRFTQPSPLHKQLSDQDKLISSQVPPSKAY
jgi:hypothetical protein